MRSICTRPVSASVMASASAGLSAFSGGTYGITTRSRMIGAGVAAAERGLSPVFFALAAVISGL
jgi:hypothetical protein